MRKLVSVATLLAVAMSLIGYGEDGANQSPGLSSPAAAASVAVPASRSAAATSKAVWKPDVSDRWQWQLRDKVNIGYAVDVYDLDLFDTPQATIDALHAQARRVICYFSAGSSEDFRADYGKFKTADKGAKLDDWPGERWLDIRSANVRAIMRSRLALAASKGCDGVEPDNVDGYANKSGFKLSATDQLNYNRFLAKEAHARGLAVGLKNDLDQIPDLVASFEYAVNEQCHEFDECDKLELFTENGKPVFNAEYQTKYVKNTGSARTKLCSTARRENIRTLVLPLELDDKVRFSCD